ACIRRGAVRRCRRRAPADRRGHRLTDSAGDRRRRHLLHDADLRRQHRRIRPAAERSARCVPRRPERRLPRRVYGGRPDAGKDGGGNQGRVRRCGRRARRRLRAQANGHVAPARVPGGAGAPSGALRPRSPGPARSVRRHARRPRHCVTLRTRAGLAIATSLGAGYLPVAPGTFGSAVGLLLWLALPRVLWIQILAIVVVAVAGSWSGNVAESHFQKNDPSQVVVDEVAGMMVTLLLNPMMGPLWMVAAFVLFRAADI